MRAFSPARRSSVEGRGGLNERRVGGRRKGGKRERCGEALQVGRERSPSASVDLGACAQRRNGRRQRASEARELLHISLQVVALAKANERATIGRGRALPSCDAQSSQPKACLFGGLVDTDCGDGLTSWAPTSMAQEATPANPRTFHRALVGALQCSFCCALEIEFLLSVFALGTCCPIGGVSIARVGGSSNGRRGRCEDGGRGARRGGSGVGKRRCAGWRVAGARLRETE